MDTMRRLTFAHIALAVLVLGGIVEPTGAQEMDAMWGEQVLKLKAADAERGQLFEEGNYAMFIHWGLYSHIGNLYKGRSYYGIGEWIMNRNMAGIPVDEYQALAKEFNPAQFDANEIAHLAKDAGMKYIVITSKHHDGWTRIQLPARIAERLVPVAQVELECRPDVDPRWGLDPGLETTILAQFATVTRAKQEPQKWMEKFGEWKHVVRVWQWEQGGKASWEVDVLQPGYCKIDLTYSGQGRIVWGVDVEGGPHIQNQQNSSHNYQRFPVGWIHFSKPGKCTVSVSCLEGDLVEASLGTIYFTPVS